MQLVAPVAHPCPEVAPTPPTRGPMLAPRLPDVKPPPCDMATWLTVSPGVLQSVMQECPQGWGGLRGIPRVCVGVTGVCPPRLQRHLSPPQVLSNARLFLENLIK